MLKHWLSVIVLALVYYAAAAQEARVDIGLLTCGLYEGPEVQISTNALASEPRNMLCVFRPSNSGPEEVYAGAFQAIGSDQELAYDRTMIWIVKGPPATRRSTGLLQQLYAADRSTPSSHPPPLVGETNSTIVLQTLADAQALNGADKQSAAVATIVLVALKLVSSPA